MKITIRFATLLTIALLLAPGMLSAQNITDPTATLQAHPSSLKSTSMSFERVRTITEGAIREAIGVQLNNLTSADVAQKLSGSYDALRSGKLVNFHAPVTSLTSHTITEQHMMQVKVNYEPRPIGGILTVRVELVPVFAGIGAASRPIAVREVSQSVDNFDEDSLGEIVADLSHQIGAEYAAK